MSTVHHLTKQRTCCASASEQFEDMHDGFQTLHIYFAHCQVLCSAQRTGGPEKDAPLAVGQLPSVASEPRVLGGGCSLVRDCTDLNEAAIRPTSYVRSVRAPLP